MHFAMAQHTGNEVHRTIRMRCPGCRHNSRLEPLFTPHDTRIQLRDGGEVGVGLRFCPDERCAEIIYVVYDINGSEIGLLYSAPAEELDFDSTGLPDNVLTALQEAATCFTQGCYVAAAMMIRKTLEELCHDRGATGSTLQERLKVLKSAVVMPQALLAGLDSLRLLGNDAAHIESRTFEDIGREEVELSFDVVKEVLKAVYQFGDLIERLDSFKKQAK